MGVVMLSDKGTYGVDNKWARSLPESKLAAICASLRTACLAMTTETAAEFDEATAWEVENAPKVRGVSGAHVLAKVLAAQLEGHVRAHGRNHCEAVNVAVRGALA